MTKKLIRFLTKWLALTISSAGLFWLLWWIIGKNDVGGEGVHNANPTNFDMFKVK